MYVWRNTGALSRYHFCNGNPKIITYCECVSESLDTQYTERMNPIMSPSLACLAVPYVSTLFLKMRDIFKKVFDNKICFYFFYNLF